MKVSDLQDVSDALKAMNKSLARIEGDMACTAEAIDANAEAIEGLSNEMRMFGEIVAPAAQMLGAIQTLTNAVAELTDRFNKYVDSTASNGLQARVMRLEQRFGER